MTIKTLSGKEKKQFAKVVDEYMVDVSTLFHKKSDLKQYDVSDGAVLVYEGVPVFILHKKGLIPTIKLLNKFESTLPKITVDLGALKFVMNGADIMRPGITQIDDGVSEGGLCLVVEEKHQGIIAVGQAMFDKIDMENMTSGKVVRNLHHLQDMWWKFSP